MNPKTMCRVCAKQKKSFSLVAFGLSAHFLGEPGNLCPQRCGVHGTGRRTECGFETGRSVTGSAMFRRDYARPGSPGPWR